MENEPELIRGQMQETRTALSEKLDTLQQKVADTVDSITTPVQETVEAVKDSVAETVDSVKETVSDTVESVKQTFDLASHVERHPWACVLGSVAAGYVLGRLLPLPSPGRYRQQLTEAPPLVSRPQPAKEERQAKKDGGQGLAGAFSEEVSKLKGLGISIGVGLLRDLVTQSVQGEIGDRIKGWMDGVTEKMGGKPLTEPIVSEEPTNKESEEPTRTENEAQSDEASRRQKETASTKNAGHSRRW